MISALLYLLFLLQELLAAGSLPLAARGASPPVVSPANEQRSPRRPLAVPTRGWQAQATDPAGNTKTIPRQQTSAGQQRTNWVF